MAGGSTKCEPQLFGVGEIAEEWIVLVDSHPPVQMRRGVNDPVSGLGGPYLCRGNLRVRRQAFADPPRRLPGSQTDGLGIDERVGRSLADGLKCRNGLAKLLPPLGVLGRQTQGFFANPERNRTEGGVRAIRDEGQNFGTLFEAMSGPSAWRARTGAPELIVQLRARGYRIAVVSNFDSRLIGLLTQLDLADALDAVVVPSEAGAAKPDPAIFEYALGRLGITAADAVFVGDDPDRDLAAASAAGLEAIDVRSLATLTDLLERIDTCFEPPRPT